MQHYDEDMEASLHPVWAAVMGGLSALYGLWPATSLYESMVQTPKDGGFGWFPFLIFGPLLFIFTMAAMVGLLGRVLVWLESNVVRAVLCLVLVLVYWGGRGVPGVVGLVLIAFIALFMCGQSIKAHQDARDRDEFFDA